MFTLPHLPPRDDFWDNTHFRSLHSGPADPHHPSGHGHGAYGTNNVITGGHGLGAGGGGGNPALLAAPSQMGPIHHPSHAHPSTLLHGAPLQPHPVRPTANTHYLAYHQYLLQQVIRDEVAIEHRKNNVRRFGAHWIRPPGVAKTLQARLEEENERKEAAEQARREAAMQELMDAQQEAATRAAAQNADDQGEVAEMERDLDAEVPEAEDEDDEEEDDDDDDDDDEEEDEDEDEDDDNVDEEQAPVLATIQNPNRQSTTHNNDDNLLGRSFVGGDEELAPGSTQHFLEAEDAELDGRAQDMRDFGVIERDLDDDIPEAGSYEHTDTEVEDSSDLDADEVEEQNQQEGNTEEMDLESSFHIVTRRRSRRGGRSSGGPESSLQALRSSFGATEDTSNANASPRDGGWLMRRLRGARRGRS